MASKETSDKEQSEKPTTSTPSETNTTKFRVSMEEKKEQVKKFTSASSATVHHSISSGLSKIKKLGFLALEKSANYVQKKKESKKNG